MLDFILQVHSEYVMYISSCNMIINIDFLKFNATKFVLWEIPTQHNVFYPILVDDKAKILPCNKTLSFA